MAALLAGVGLAGCGIDQRADALPTAFTSPGKYNIYTCQDIENTTVGTAHAADRTGAIDGPGIARRGGEFVNAIAYRTEYVQARGDLLELTKAKADKQCAADSKFSSGRAVF